MFVRKRPAKKAKSGFTWTVYIDYMDLSGLKKRYTKGGFKTKKEALNHGYEMQQNLNKSGGELHITQKTFNDVFEEYMEIEGKYRYAGTTKISYGNAFNNHIKNSIGMSKIINLRYKNVQEFFNSIDNLGIVTCQSIKRVFSLTFKYAIKNGYVQNNPMPMIEVRGQDTSRERGYLEYNRLEEMVEELLDDYRKKKIFSRLSYCVFLYLSYFLGTRKAETLALTKKDIDFKENVIFINKQLVYQGMKKKDYYVKDILKTKLSNASIPMCGKLKSILTKWIEMNPYDLLCCNGNGDYIIPTDMDRCLKRIAEKKGFNFHPHMLRHSFVTNLVQSGVDIKTVSELARHSEVTTTMNVYARTNDILKQKAIKTAFDKPVFDEGYKKVTN